MKRIIKKLPVIIVGIITALCILIATAVEATSSDLDYINLYEVVVDPRNDGTLDISIHLNWEVLDSTSEGPLEWVKIGIPNKYVDEIEAATNNISKIKYYSDNGSYIRIDFSKKYHANEVVDFAFKFHISRMYKLNSDSCYYDYNPGWFEEIKIKKAIVKWKTDNVNYINTYDYISDGYYVYEKTDLDYGECIKVKANYAKESFTGLSEKMQYSNSWRTTKDIIIIIVVILIIIAIIVGICVAAKVSTDPYMENRGFCGPHYYFFYSRHRYYSAGVDKTGKKLVNPDTVMHSTGSGGHSSCACACACACAGGGRAGCSRKDFYNTNIQTIRIRKVLNGELNKLK